MKVPKYVRDLVERGRLRPAPLDEQASMADVSENKGVYGYMFRFYRHSNNQRERVFEQEAERLVNWANREHAEAKIHYHKWYSTKDHRKPYYKRDYALLTITDPVAQKLEKLIAEVSKSR